MSIAKRTSVESSTWDYRDILGSPKNGGSSSIKTGVLRGVLDGVKLGVLRGLSPPMNSSRVPNVHLPSYIQVISECGTH